MDTKGFLGSAGNSGNTFIWKKEGRASIVIHPKHGFKQRSVVWIPEVVTERVGRVEKETLQKKMFKSPGINDNCPLAEFIEYLEENDSIEEDEVVLQFGSTKKAETYTKGDVLGLKGFNYKKKLKPTQQFVFNIVDIENVEGGIQVIDPTPPSLSQNIASLIKTTIKRKGDVEGDPMQTPYVIGLSFDEDAAPALKYKAEALWDEDVTDEVMELLDKAGNDLSPYYNPDTPEEIWEVLVVGINDLTADFEPTFLSKKTKKNGSKKIEEEVVEEEELVEEKVVKPKKTSKKVIAKPKEEPKKNEEEVEMEECMGCGKMISVDAMKCPYCKAAFTIIDEEETKDEPKEEVVEEMWTCPNKKCGAENPINKSRCGDCGEKRPK